MVLLARPFEDIAHGKEYRPRTHTDCATGVEPDVRVPLSVPLGRCRRTEYGRTHGVEHRVLGAFDSSGMYVPLRILPKAFLLTVPVSGCRGHTVPPHPLVGSSLRASLGERKCFPTIYRRTRWNTMTMTPFPLK